MELRDYLSVLRRRWLTVALVTVTSIVIAAAMTLLVKPEYTASARMFFAVQGGQSISDLQQGTTYAQNQLASYAEVAESELVLSPVIEDLGLRVTPSQLASNIEVDVPSDTQTLTVTATYDQPGQAAAIANAIADELAQVAGGLAPRQADGSETVTATVFARAHAPVAPSSPDVRTNLILSMLVGIALGFCVALLRNALDTKVRDERDVAVVTERAVIGTVPFVREKEDHHVFMTDDPLGLRAEAIRRLRTNLQFFNVGAPSSSVVVTSSVPGEGKSTVAINLAVALSDTGSRVLLVDGDLRRPSVAGYMGLEGSAGLTSVLIGRAEFEDVAQRWKDSQLTVLAAGVSPPNPSELLGSAAMELLLHEASQKFDVVVIDSSPLLPVTDAAVLSKIASSTLLVAGADRITKAQLRQSINSLEAVEAKIIGVALNKVSQRRGGYYYYESYAPTQITVAEDEKGTERGKISPDLPPGSVTKSPAARGYSGDSAASAPPAQREDAPRRRSTWPGRPLSKDGSNR